MKKIIKIIPPTFYHTFMIHHKFGRIKPVTSKNEMGVFLARLEDGSTEWVHPREIFYEKINLN